MKVEDFVNNYSAEYMLVFHGVKIEKESALSKISKFLFEPRYEVNSLNFKLVTT